MQNFSVALLAAFEIQHIAGDMAHIYGHGVVLAADFANIGRAGAALSGLAESDPAAFFGHHGADTAATQQKTDGGDHIGQIQSDRFHNFLPGPC